jgi:hypothetical protein
MRVLGLIATLALLGAGVYALQQVLPEDDETSAVSQSPSTASPAKKKAKHKAKAKPKPKYTAAQRRQRAAAVTALRDAGYRPVHLADYDARKVLRVLIGRGEGGERAFFFTSSQYIGNDAAEDSRRIRVARAGNRSVALSYKLRNGKSARVLFHWDGNALAPQTTIPPFELRR